LITARAQLDLWGYRLRSVVGRVTGIWPDFDHTALDDARTTARLLRGLLSEAPDSLNLTTSALIDWPTASSRPIPTRHRVTAIGRNLVHLVDQLPRARGHHQVDSCALARYRAVLDRAVDDHRIDAHEAAELAELIKAGGLTRSAVEDVHRELLDRQRVDAHADGVITWEEAASLRKLAELVGMPEHIAIEEMLGRQDKARRQALAGWRVVGIGLTDEVADILDLAADHTAATGTSITAPTKLVVARNEDQSVPRVRRAAADGRLVLNPEQARNHLLAVIEQAMPAPVADAPTYRRTPIVRWDEHWRPVELDPHDCIGRFDEDARARALHRVGAGHAPAANAPFRRTVELAPATLAATRADVPTAQQMHANQTSGTPRYMPPRESDLAAASGRAPARPATSGPPSPAPSQGPTSATDRRPVRSTPTSSPASPPRQARGVERARIASGVFFLVLASLLVLITALAALGGTPLGAVTLALLIAAALYWGGAKLIRRKN